MLKLFLFVFVYAAFAIIDETKPGAPFDIQDPNSDQEHMNRVWAAINHELNNQPCNTEPYYLIPIKILSAKSQVVAGIKNIYEVLVGESSCKKEEMQATELTQANCKLRDGANRAIYKLSVWERPWDNFIQYTAEKVRNVDAKENF